MREQGVGSVVVVDDERAVGILTERDLVRIAAAGVGTRDRRRLDDARPRLGRARRRGDDRVREPRRARLPAHPGRRRRPARRHRVDARPDAHRADPAGREPRARGAARSRRRRRRRDHDRRRARPRRLLPLPPVQRGRARRDALDRGRVVPALSRASCPTLRSGRAFIDEIRPAREIPNEVKAVLPEIALAARARAAARPAPHDRLAARRVARLPAVARPDHHRAAHPGAAGLCRRPDAAVRPLPAPARAADDRPASRARLRGQLPLHAARRRARRPSTPGASSST